MHQQKDNCVIVGLGSTGLSCAKYLAAQNCLFTVVDSREKPPGLNELRENYPHVQCQLGDISQETLLKASSLVVSPGVGLKSKFLSKAIASGVPVTGDIDIFSRAATAPIIAVTGSNGKSTVVALVAAILDAAGIRYGMGGNLDGDRFKPALDLLDDEEKQFYLLELSSFQLETTKSLNAEVAVMLNVSEDHMDRYDSLDEYQQAKENIFIGCRQVVINDDEFDTSYVQEIATGATALHYSTSEVFDNGFGVMKEGDEKLLVYKNAERLEKVIATDELKIVGAHNLSNVLAAAAICKAINVDTAAIRSALLKFSGLPHRCELVATVKGVRFYNDSKATNVGAAVAALDGLAEQTKGDIHLIAGGSSKDADFEPLAASIHRCVATTLLIGESASVISQQLDNSVLSATVSFCETLQQAVEQASKNAKEGDIVILSPACASFDMFDNYQHRGDVFTGVARSLL